VNLDKAKKINWDWPRFWEETGNDLQLCKELVELFLVSAKGLIEEMEKALEKGHLSILKEKAHSLKGAAGTIYLEDVRERALRIEREDLPPEQYQKLISEIKVLCNYFADEVQECLSS